MKKILFVCFVLSLFILIACGSDRGTSSSSPIAISVTQFCVPVERDNIDFSILNDVRIILEQESVFTDTAQNPELLLRSALETVFSYLGVPNSEIPQWANDIINEELARNPETPDFSILNQVYQGLLQDPQYSDLQEPSRREELIEVSVRGVIDALGDPFANYMPADLWQSGAADSSGRYRGMGVTVQQDDEGIGIGSVLSGSPAERSGIKAGDVILGVNNLSTENCNIRQFILRIKNIDNPTMNLKIARESSTSTKDKVLEITVTMEQIKQIFLSTYPGIELPNGRGNTTKDLTYRCNGGSLTVGLPCPFADLDNDGISDILYIRIHSFDDQMEHDLRYFLENINPSSFRGAIVDVRGNLGGLVSTTINAVDFFLPTNDVIYTNRNARGRIITTKSNKVTYLPPDMPLVILMNKDSYSAAELFSAALSDHERAIIVSRDERSGGKGSVNDYFTLRNGEYGAVYVSIAMWLTPNREAIEAQDLDNDGYYEIGGLRPDIHVPWSDEDFTKGNQDVNYDPTLQAALDYIFKHLGD